MFSACVLGRCVASTVLLVSTQNLRRALAASVHGQLRRDKECAFSGVTNSGRVWRKVPESDARSVPETVSGENSSLPQSLKKSQFR